MHFSRTLILLLAGLGLVSPAHSPDAKTDPSLELTDYTLVIDLSNFEERADGIFDGALEKRPNSAACCVVATSVVACTGAAFVYQVATSIAGQLKGNSDAKDFTPHIGAVDGVTWDVYAIAANCDTITQLCALREVLTKHFEPRNKRVFGVHCLTLSHGATWKSYVIIITRKGTPLDSYYYGGSNSFGNCSWGGEDDLYRMRL